MSRYLTAVVAGLALAAVVATAEQPAAPKGPKEGARRFEPGKMPLLGPKMLEDLSLTAEQKTKYEEINAKFEKERDAYLAAHKPDPALRDEMKAAREAGDKAKMKELGEKARAENAPLMEIRKKHMDELKATLTAEQKAKLEEVATKMKERRREHGPAGGAPKPDAPAAGEKK
jgi:Spy/CpxP family protein refolding chaperone